MKNQPNRYSFFAAQPVGQQQKVKVNRASQLVLGLTWSPTGRPSMQPNRCSKVTVLIIKVTAAQPVRRS